MFHKVKEVVPLQDMRPVSYTHLGSRPCDCAGVRGGVAALRLGAAGARPRTLAPRGAPAFTAAFASNAWGFNLKLGTVPHLRLRGAIVSSA